MNSCMPPLTGLNGAKTARHGRLKHRAAAPAAPQMDDLQVTGHGAKAAAAAAVESKNRGNEREVVRLVLSDR